MALRRTAEHSPSFFIGAERSLHSGTAMTDETAKTARLMKVIDAIVAELSRQGVAEAVADLGFDPVAMAEVVIKAADGDVVRFPGFRGH